jgi:hypothetical protein
MNPTIERGWLPSKESLLKLSIEAVMSLKLSCVNYSNSGGVLYFLTWVFNNGVYSPPMHTYSAEPPKNFEIPSEAEIGTIDLGWACDDLMIKVDIKDRAGERIGYCHGTSDTTTTRAVELRKNEHIVSVHVDTGRSKC